MSKPGFSRDNTVEINAVRLELVSGEIIDLMNMFVEMNIFVNIRGMGITGNIIFHDTINVANNGPIIGGEKVFIRWRSPRYQDFSEQLFRVSQQNEREPEANQAAIVKLELISDTMYHLLGSNLSRGYNTQYSVAAKKLYEELGLDKQFYADASTGLINIAVPRTYSVIENLQWMANRARSSDNMPFCVFEDLDGMNFSSWSKILSSDSKVKLIHQPQNTEEDFEKEFRNILSMEFNPNCKDSLEYRRKGLMGKTEQVYSPLSKTMSESLKSYKDYSNSVPTLNPGKPWLEEISQDGYSFLLKKFDNSQLNIFNRDALNHSLGMSPVTILTSGDDQMRLGVVVELNLLGLQPQTTKSGTIPEKYINGKFVVTSLKHTIRPSEYRLYWGLSLESYLNEVNNNG